MTDWVDISKQGLTTIMNDTWFDISKGGLTTLLNVDFPQDILYLDCSNNQLTSLEGIPSTVIELDCSDNQLTSLIDCLMGIEVLWCCGNRLTDFNCWINNPPVHLKNLICNQNLITSLKGLPSTLHNLYCGDNNITSLEGIPPNLIELGCDNNEIISLKHIPIHLRVLYCQNNLLKSLEWLPHTCDAYYEGNPCNYVPQEVDQIRERSYIRNVQKGIDIINKLLLTRLQRLIYKAWHYYWYDQRDEKGHSRACKDIAKQLIN